MKTNLVLASAVAALPTVVLARDLVLNQARATASVVLAADAVSPRPTPPPGWDRFEPKHLFGRAASSQTPLTMMIAPDNTCGWISGSYAIPYSCGPGATCGLVQAQETFSGMAVCYNSVGFGFRFACVDYNMYKSSSCDHLCAENTQIVKWAAPHCNTVSFPGNITDYWCNSVSYSRAQGAYTTYAGQTEVRSYTRFVQTISSSLPTAATIGGPAVTGTDAGIPASATKTGYDGNNNGGGRGDSRSKTPVGAIVGGVVGGVAFIAIGLLALVLLLRRNKKNSGKSQTTSSDHSPMPPNATPGVPVTQSYYGVPPSQGCPPQQNTPSPPVGYYSPGGAVEPSSPTQSHMTDPRISHLTTSPAPTWTNSYTATPPGQQRPTGFSPVGGTSPIEGRPHTQVQSQPQPQLQGLLHEAPAQTGDNHRGQMHELA
ncbi:uncharacterized protein MAM_06234 [Metarhizium album ARSEF 1941]|uniref:Uncharacterized protein n=1 Tax=Metarhizium album (strain ARSEF 1941) TaxID=1081103 RepID=A0A0B2WQV3_METAS|nr:uncharacterized protein MAM_06234 [Metarhizium album ARSEF 1941]KHN95872.1 hypothetical protein MAM_06234 [Metarhizium album ARSEF 1941]